MYGITFITLLKIDIPNFLISTSIEEQNDGFI